MVPPSQASHQVRFGEFQLDLRTGELLNNDHKLTLQDQPFQVLALLLEHPGQLVSRDELRKRLWPSDTFVDFDRGLNKAVNRLREALGDSAENPLFIETLPKKGYRFVVPVETVFQHPTSGQSPDRPASAEPVLTRAANLNIAATVLGMAVIICAAGWLVWRVPGRSTAAIRSIAVLPLENLSGDATQDYFADGMTDALITDLGQISALRVISRTSTMQFRGSRKSLQQIARELKVDAIVEGTVLRSGDHVRITAKLIQVPTDKHLWAESYQGDLRDVLGLQSQVARAIASEIRVKLTPQQQAALRSPRAINPDAYDDYLRALTQSETVDGLRLSIAYFEQALRKQPDYAEAHVELGDTYVLLAELLNLPTREAFPHAKAEALKALQFDESLAEAHELLGAVNFLYDWDFPAAEKEFQRAIALNPNSTSAHNSYADFLNAMGHPDAAISERVVIRQIDPLHEDIGWQEYWAGRYDPAIEKARSVLAVDPGSYQAHISLGLSLEQQHQYRAAIEELQKATDLSNDKMWTAFVAHAKALAGDKAAALKILADLQALSRHTYVSPWCFAVIYAGLNNKEQAFFWLEKCYQGREYNLVFSRVWPIFDPVRSDPRYDDLLRRVGLPR